MFLDHWKIPVFAVLDLFFLSSWMLASSFVSRECDTWHSGRKFKVSFNSSGWLAGGAGAVAAAADGEHNHSSHSKQGVAADARAAGSDRRLPVPPAPHHRSDLPCIVVHSQFGFDIVETM